MDTAAEPLTGNLGNGVGLFKRENDFNSRLSSPSMRWVVLALASTLMWSNFYAYDIPAALNTPLQGYLGSSDQDYQFQINSFYSVYSLPNLILPFFGGILIDKFGTRKLTVILSGLQLLGQTLFSIGAQKRNIGLMIFGRLVFGLGGETLTSSQARVTSKYFKGRELAFALGFNLAIARMGSVANDVISPAIALKWSVPLAVWMGTVTTFVSFSCAIALGILDWKISKAVLHPRKETQMLHVVMSPMSANPPIATSAAFLPHSGQLHDPDGVTPEEVISCSDIFNFPPQFWLLCLVLIVMHATVVPFNTIHSAFLQTKWYPNDPQTASQIMAIPDTISAVLVPFVGTFTDRYGHRCKTLIVCGILMGSVHLTLGFAHPPNSVPSPIPPLIVLGIGYSLLLTFWSGIPLVVGEKRQGSAFGISVACLNFSLFLFPLIVSGMVNADPTYFTTEMFFATFSFLGSLVAFVNMLVDQHRTGGILELPEKDAVEHSQGDMIPLSEFDDDVPLTQDAFFDE